MTNNPTIDGVSRELLERVATESDHMLGFTYASNCDECRSAVDQLRALLDAPVVERQPVAWETIGINEYGLSCRKAVTETKPEIEQVWILWGDRFTIKQNALYTAPPEVAALQSTIAQLQTRVAELESGRGEPVAWLHTMHFDEGCGYQSRITVSPDNAFGKPGLNYDSLFRVTSEPLFTTTAALNGERK